MPDSLRIILLQSEQDCTCLSQALRRDHIEFDATRIDSLTALRQALEQGPWHLILANHRLPHCKPSNCFRTGTLPSPFC